MPEKYLYKDKVLQRKEVEDAAKQSGMDIDTYYKKAGLQRVNDNYNFNGKTVPAEEIFEAAKQSKMGFDDYIQKAQIVPIDDVKKKEPSEPLSKEPLDGGLNGTTSTIPTIQLSDVEVGIYPISKVSEAKEYAQMQRPKKTTQTYGGKTSEIEIGGMEADPEGTAKAEKIYSELEKKGFGKDFVESLSDFPQDAFNNQTTSKETLINLYQNNPIKFKQLTNEAKTKYAIRDAAAKRTFDELGDVKDKENIASQRGIYEGNQYSSADEVAPQNMQEFYGIIRKKQDLINANIDDPEQKKKAQERLRETYSQAINPTSLDFKEEYEQSGISDKLDINQYAGLKTLELFEPEKAQALLSVINENIIPQWNVNVQKSPDEQMKGIVKDSALASKLGGHLSQLTINQRIGKEEVLRELSNIGAANEYDNLVSEQKDLKQQYKEASTPDEQLAIYQKSLFNEQRLKQLEQTELENDKKYPLTATLKYENQVKELVNNRGIGVGGFMYNRYAHGVGSGIDAVENLVTSIFGSESDKAKLRMKRLGEGKQFEASVYLPESERGTGSPVILEASDELKTKVKNILNGRSLSSLSDDERQKITDLVANNQSQIKTITNPDAGKSKNFWSKATGMTIAGFTSDIGAFITKMGLMQGAGLGTKAAEATTLFMDGYDAAFNKKISEGASVESASEYGILHGAVLSLMKKFGSKYETIMNVVKGGKSPVSKYIAGLSEESWNKLASESKPLLSKVGKTVKDIGKEQGKMIGTFGVIAPTASSIADNIFYDDNKSIEQMGTEAFESAKEMAIGGIGFGIFGAAKGLMKTRATPVEKAALWELGDNPEIGKARIDEAVRLNDLTEKEGELKKEIIDHVAKLIDQVPEATDRGKILNDQQRANYLFNLAVKESYKEKAKTLPEKQSEEAKQKALVADKENQIELEALTEKQKNDRKDKLEKAISKVDENGKPELSEKEMADAKAELEALENVIKKDSTKEEELPDLSVPIEGTDKKGVPIGEDVPKPTDVKNENLNRLIFDRETGQPLDGIDEQMAEKLIDKAISKSKTTDEANGKLDELGYNLRSQANADFNEFVQDRIDGKTDMTFSEWKNGKQKSENKPILNEEQLGEDVPKPTDVVVDKVDDVGGDVVGKTFRDNYNRTFEVKGENAGILTLEDVDTGKVLRKKKSEVLSDFKEITEPDVVDKTKTITEHLPKGGELKGVTEIDVSENGEEVSYGTKTRKTSITVKGLSAEEIKQEIKFEKQVLERSKRDAANFNEDEIRSAKGMTRQEKEDAIKMHKQSLINNEQVEKIVIPFYEKHLEIAEQSLKETTKAETPTPTQESNVVEGSGGVGGENKFKGWYDRLNEIRNGSRDEKAAIAAKKLATEIFEDKQFLLSLPSDKRTVDGIYSLMSGRGELIDALNSEAKAVEQSLLTQEVRAEQPTVSEPKPEITKLEKERDAEIEKVGKPNLKLDLVSAKDLVDSKDPIGNREKHNELKERYKNLRKLIDCL